MNIEGNVNLDKKNNLINVIPGGSFVNRTMDYQSMDLVVAAINSYPTELQFVPKYNVCVYSLYNTLNFHDFTWYVEGDYKTNEAILGSSDRLENHDGHFYYSSLAYNNAKAKFGITLQAKRTENFVLRTSPNESLLQGVLNYIPPISKQNALRLLARYTPATQYLGEFGYQGDIVWTPKKGYTLSLNYSNITDLENNPLYFEINGALELNKSKKIKSEIGLQTVHYNFYVYRKEASPLVKTLTPFGEVTWKINKKKSLRLEAQYLMTKEDYGTWIFGLLEYNIAPKFSFAVSDMYNSAPNPDNAKAKKLHYPNAFVAYTAGPNRFTFAYVKQVDGVNCTGGVCRYEPAFSGFKFTVTTSF